MLGASYNPREPQNHKLESVCEFEACKNVKRMVTLVTCNITTNLSKNVQSNSTWVGCRLNHQNLVLNIRMI